jgi:hypothetical protein
VTVGREAPLGSGFADALWVDLEGHLTVIEVKLRSNPEVRREVLAQALSYGAFLEGMSIDEFVDSIARPFLTKTHGSNIDGLNLPSAVAALADVEVDEESFWSGLEASLARGDFRILIVVDEPHPQLRRSVAYVNRHADFELYLVEVGYFRSDDGSHEILSPRILDIPDRKPVRGSTGASSRTWDPDAYFEQVHARSPEVEQSLRTLYSKLDQFERDGLIELRFGSGKQGNLVVALPEVSKSVLWIRSSGSIQFPRYPMRRDLGYTDDEITGYMEQIADASGASPAKYRNQQEPQIVTPETLSAPGVVDKVVEVVEMIARDFAERYP